jgi:hypothetical protein
VLAREIIRAEGRAHYERLVAQLHERAFSRQGPFAYLDHVAADRSADINRIFRKLQRLAAHEKRA